MINSKYNHNVNDITKNKPVHVIMVLNICVKFQCFRWFSSYRVDTIMRYMKISKTVLKLQSGHECVVKTAIFQCSKGNNGQRMQSRVMVPTLCMSSHPP